MLESDTSPDLNTPEPQCLKHGTIALLYEAMRDDTKMTQPWPQ